MTSTDEHVEQYKAVLSLLERTLRYLEGIQCDRDTLASYRRVLRFLRTRTERDIIDILADKQRTAPHSSRRDYTEEISDDMIRSLSPDRVREYVEDLSISRNFLERIAMLRFGVPKSVVSHGRGRKALGEKILTLAAHEMTHAAIERAVSAKNPNC